MLNWRQVKRPARLSLAAGLSSAALVAGCGGGSDSEQISELMGDVQQAFRKGDAATVCNSLSTAAQAHVGSAAHGDRDPCRADLGVFIDMIREAPEKDEHRQQPRIQRVEVEGDRATAVADYGRSAVRVPLVREAGEWKVDALYGDIPAARQEDKYP
jgi:hypothetical protein